MRKLLGGLLAGTFILSACQPKAPTTGPAVPSAAPKATARPSTAPSAATSAAPGLVPAAAPRKLGKPATATTALRGTVALDAGYLVARGQGRALAIGGKQVVGADGATLIGADGGTLIGADGATAIANARGQIVAAGAGNVIAAADARLIGADGATLIGADGATLIGADGGSLIGNDGGTLIGADGGTYHLAQTPALGDRAPVAGTLVGAIDLRDGKPVQLGTADGKPVYLIYTNAQGEYEIFLDPAVAPHVMIVSGAPGSTDRRLAANVLAGLGEGGRVDVDEVQSAVTDYLRACVAVRLRSAFASDDPTSFLADNFDPGLRELVTPACEELAAAGEAAGFRRLPPLAQRRAVQAAVDAALSRVDLAAVPMDPVLQRRNKIPGGALDVMREVLKRVEAATRKALQADPGFGARSETVAFANQLRPAADPYTLAKPGDMNDLIVDAFLVRPDDELTDVPAMAMLELGEDPSLGNSIEGSGVAFFAAAATALFFDEEGVADAKRAFTEATRREVAAGRSEPAPGAAPAPPDVARPALTLVATLPAAVEPRVTEKLDDKGRLRVVPLPMPIAVDDAADGPIVYVADREADRVLRVAADGTITTLAGGGKPLDLDVGGMALAPDGALWLTSYNRHRLIRIPDPRADQVLAEIVAGKDDPPLLMEGADGPVPAAEATFNEPTGLAFGPDGALYVADSADRRIRRVDVAAAARTVTTWAGGPTVVQRDGKPYLQGEPWFDVGRAARFDYPLALAFGPAGLVIGDRGDGRIRLAKPSLPGRADEAGPVVMIAGANQHGIGAGNGAVLLSDLIDPFAVAAAPDGRILIGDVGHRALRAWLPGGWIVTLHDGPTFQPSGLAVGKDGKTAWVADGEARTVSRFVLP